ISWGLIDAKNKAPAASAKPSLRGRATYRKSRKTIIVRTIDATIARDPDKIAVSPKTTAPNQNLRCGELGFRNSHSPTESAAKRPQKNSAGFLPRRKSSSGISWRYTRFK